MGQPQEAPVNKILVTDTYIRAEQVTKAGCASDWLLSYRVMFVLYGLYRTIVHGVRRPSAALTPKTANTKITIQYSIYTEVLCDWLLLSLPYQTNSYHSCLVWLPQSPSLLSQLKTEIIIIIINPSIHPQPLSQSTSRHILCVSKHLLLLLLLLYSPLTQSALWSRLYVPTLFPVVAGQ